MKTRLYVFLSILIGLVFCVLPDCGGQVLLPTAEAAPTCSRR